MNRFLIKKDGKRVGVIEKDDARDAGAAAVLRWGPGTYDVSLIRINEEGGVRNGSMTEPCCNHEERNMAGGCINCGDPCW